MRARWSATGPQDPVQLRRTQKINKKEYYLLYYCYCM